MARLTSDQIRTQLASQLGVGVNPSLAPFLEQGYSRTRQGPFPSFAQQQRDLGSTLVNNLGGFGAYGIPTGLAQANQILARGGQLDPRLFNNQLAEIDRGTNVAQDEFRGELARMGLQGSSAGLATQAAIGQGGENRAAALRAAEARAVDERQRQNVALLIDTFINPITQQTGIEREIGIQQSALSQQNQQNQTNAYLQLAAALAGAYAG